jgi:hypothetical protein
MAVRPKGTAQLGVDIDAKVLAAARAFAEERGEKLLEVVEEALRRHMAYPPPTKVPETPPPPEPLPDAEPVKSKGKKKR